MLLSTKSRETPWPSGCVGQYNATQMYFSQSYGFESRWSLIFLFSYYFAFLGNFISFLILEGKATTSKILYSFIHLTLVLSFNGSLKNNMIYIRDKTLNNFACSVFRNLKPIGFC